MLQGKEHQRRSGLDGKVRAASAAGIGAPPRVGSLPFYVPGYPVPDVLPTRYRQRRQWARRTRAPPVADEAKEEEWLPGSFSGSVALTSNYVSRGITQTDNNPAIQGTLEYAIETGILGSSVYIGTFASSAKLEGDTDTAHVEIDALFGIRGDIGDTGLSWDLGGAFYAYPGTTRRDNFDYWEIPLTLTYRARIGWRLSFTMRRLPNTSSTPASAIIRTFN